MLLKRYKEELLDLIYPKTCFGCKKPLPASLEGYLCPDCLNKLDKPQPPFCISCGRPIDIMDIDRCSDCTGSNYYFKRGYTASLYEGLVKECIHSFKYSSQTYLACTLARLMIDFAFEYIDLDKIDAVVPIPLHWIRHRDRGFNQTAILGRMLGKRIGIPFIGNGLSRTKIIKPQVELPRKGRITNIKGAFKVTRPKKFFGKHILLIDDVFTTGATLNECSRVLLDNGAKEVWVFTLARGIS